MPRKPNELPQPCPLCGRRNGTYQYVIFQPKEYQRYYPSSPNAEHIRGIKRSSHVICRIGHYDPNYYQAMKNGRVKRGIKRPYGKFWHSFTVRWAPLTLSRHGRNVGLGDYFGEFLDEEWHHTSITISPEPWMSEKIKEFGWYMVPDKEGRWGGLETLRIARRELKDPLKLASIQTT